MKIPSSNHGRTCCVQKLFLTFRSIFVHNMFSTMFCKKKSFWQTFTCTWLCFAKIASLQIESVTKLHVTNVLELLVFSMKSRLVSRRSFEIKSVLIFNWLFLWNSEIWFDCLFIKIDLLSKFNFQHISRNSVTFWWDLNSHTKSPLHLLSSLINQHFLYSIFFIRFVFLFCDQVGLEKDFIRVDTW